MSFQRIEKSFAVFDDRSDNRIGMSGTRVETRLYIEREYVLISPSALSLSPLVNRSIRCVLLRVLILPISESEDIYC